MLFLKKSLNSKMSNSYGACIKLKKEVARFMLVWKQTLLGPVVSTLLYFVVFTPVFYDKMIGDVSYLTFIAPGLILMGMINNAFMNSSSSIVISKYDGSIYDLMLLPLSEFEMMMTYSLSSLVRGVLVGIMTLIPVLFFVHIPFTHFFIV